jgi:hypothetical protein
MQVFVCNYDTEIGENAELYTQSASGLQYLLLLCTTNEN